MVSVSDLDGIERTAVVTAPTLYEAVAAAPVALREDEGRKWTLDGQCLRAAACGRAPCASERLLAGKPS
jgi:hypothetical protein